MALTKNNVPTFAQGTYNHVKMAIKDGMVTSPAFVYLTDTERLAFLDVDEDLHLISGGDAGSYYIVPIEKINELFKN